MSAIRRGLAALAAATVLALSAAAPASAVSAVIATAPELVSIDAPAPGHSSTWTMSVTNRTDRALPVGLAVEGADGPLTAGPTPLAISVTTASGTALLDGVPAGELIGTTVPLAPLDPGETRELRGEATLPRAAGDDYQGADGRLTFRVTASVEPAAAPAGSLSRTGAELAAAAALLAGLLAGGTALIDIGRRRRTQHD